MSLTFEVPLPPRGVSSNARGKWPRIRATTQYREAVGWAIREQHRPKPGRSLFGPPPDKVRVSLLFGIKGGRRVQGYQPQDEPNAVAAFKAGFDAMKDQQVIVDDSRRHMEIGTVEISSKVGPFVRVTIEEVTE